ncbi:MAG: hypothetical protein AB7I44_21100 [Hyphomicrobiaceae bacterium]
MFQPHQLRDITSFTDAAYKLYEQGVFIDLQYEEFTGFGILPGNQKERLVGVTFLIIQYEFKVGKYGASFVDCHLITTNNERLVLRDSSQGIHEQLKSLCATRTKANHPYPNMGVYVRKGLRYQDNAYVNAQGESLTSRTYYLT